MADKFTAIPYGPAGADEDNNWMASVLGGAGKLGNGQNDWAKLVGFSGPAIGDGRGTNPDDTFTGTNPEFLRFLQENGYSVGQRDVGKGVFEQAVLDKSGNRVGAGSYGRNDGLGDFLSLASILSMPFTVGGLDLASLGAGEAGLGLVEAGLGGMAEGAAGVGGISTGGGLSGMSAGAGLGDIVGEVLTNAGLGTSALSGGLSWGDAKKALDVVKKFTGGDGGSGGSNANSGGNGLMDMLLLSMMGNDNAPQQLYMPVSQWSVRDIFGGQE